MARKTPLWDVTGLMPSEDRPADSVCSMSSIQDTMAAKSKSYANKYQQFVVDYVVEWEKVVRTRIDAGIKKAETLRRDLDHYQKKVEELRLQTNKVMAKGKQVKSDAAEKLKRNEEKLLSAKQSYNKVATDLCILMEEVTERSWRDLHPMLIKVAQFEMTLSSDQSKIFANLNSIVDTLKTIASSNGIPATPRLKDMSTLKPELLSTRPGGVANLAIEAGSSFSPTSFGGSTDFSFLAAPPGSVGPQGMGGFPVQVGGNSLSPTNTGLPNSSSMGSNYGQNSLSLVPSPASGPPSYEPPSSLSMLQISGSSAPPPTFDDVYGLGSQSVTSMPALGGGGAANYHRSNSASQSLDGGYAGYSPAPGGGDSVYSGYSGYMSAAPAAPPPPPPSQPPPPPPGSSYNPPAMPSSAPPSNSPSSWGVPTPSYGGYQPAPSYAPPPSGAYGQPPAPPIGYQSYGQQAPQHRPYG